MHRQQKWFYSISAALICSLIVACSGRDSTDAALDALESAIVATEQALTEQFGTQLSPDEIFIARKKNLEARGRELQAAYAPVRDLDVAKISRDQEKRRNALRERSIAIAADLIDAQLHKNTP